MNKYILNTNYKVENEYKYIFLCGTKYTYGDNKDKRNVLREFLMQKSQCYIPIILEENFIFRTSRTSNKLFYDDVYMKNLYQVEMLFNCLSDNNIIINESISTGAEIGLFLSYPDSVKKTCLLIPDRIAVEEDKIGGFIRLAFMRKGKDTSTLTYFNYYPRMKKTIISTDTQYWHTYFYRDQIGNNLGKNIIGFIEQNNIAPQFKFAKKKEKIKKGYIHYNVDKKGKLTITIPPRILLSCIAAIMNIEELQKSLFGEKNAKELRWHIKNLINWLKKVFSNTIEEVEIGMRTKYIKKTAISLDLNIKGVYISGVVGMCLYFYQAAGFIKIVKSKKEEKKIIIKRLILKDSERHNCFFYEKYKEMIKIPPPKQI